MKNKVLIIVGPTASGKSDLAVRLALRCGGEVVSADSRQVYKGLNVGTGKITKREMLGVRHHLLDVADPKKQFSAAEYKTLADAAIADILKRGKLPIVAGGTGFYIDALTGAQVLPDVPPDPLLRKKLEQKTLEQLFKMLEKKDPARAKTIDAKNKVRLVRALEIVAVLGQVPLQTVSSKLPTHHFIFIGLNPEKATLEKKIYARLLKRMPAVLREAKKLHADGFTYKRMEQLGLEYRYLARFLQNKLSKEEMLAELFMESKRYAKRQMTWFKRNKAIRWFPTPSAASAYTTRLLRAK